MKKRPRWLGLIFVGILLLAFLPSPSKESPVTANPTPVGGALATLLTQETSFRFSSGFSFTVPEGWYVLSKEDSYLLQDPSRQISAVFAQSKEMDGLDAIKDAWKAYWPDFNLAIYRTVVPTDDKSEQKWEQIVKPLYYVSDPNDPYKIDVNRSVGAFARKKGRYWFVFLHDGAVAAADRRMAQVVSIAGMLRAPDSGKPETGAPEKPVWDEIKQKAFEEFIDHGRDLCKIPGVAVGIVQDGKIIYEKGFGVRESGKKDPVTPKTLFAIASITKPLTTLLMAKLADEGKLDWDSPVTQFLPNFRLADPALTKELTLRYSVCACTGLPRQDMDLIFPLSETTPKGMLDKMALISPTTGFGETFQYSNQMVAAGGYAAAQAVTAEADFGDAYRFALQTEVFDPLGMKNSLLNGLDVVLKEYATPHAQTLDRDFKPIPLADESWMDPVQPAGAVWSNVEDLAQVISLELSKGLKSDGSRFVSEKNLLKRREPLTRINADSFYGLGLVISKEDGVTVVGHGGSATGFSTDLSFLPDQGMGLVVLTNARGSDAYTTAVRDRFLELLTGKPPHAQDDFEKWYSDRRTMDGKIRSFFNFSAIQSWVSDYAGTYSNPDLGQVTLRNDNEGAMFDQGRWKAPMAAYYNRNGEVRFILTEPPMSWVGFVLKDDEGHKTLTYETPQKKYVFEWLGQGNR